jgi:diaminohydroxyphosphoribosylaminopyrimidine deaminase / 5-amino-6-(5-phosphoribosylamino)uracil reductase
VLAPNCNVPPQANIVGSGHPPVWIICGDSSKCGSLAAHPGVRIFDIGASPDGTLNLRLALMRMTAEGVTRLLVEGGPSTARGFVKSNLADEIIIIQGAATLTENATMLPFADRGLELVSSSNAFTLTERRKAGADTISVFRSTTHWQV